MGQYKNIAKEIISAPSVQIGLGAAICVSLVVLVWKIKRTIKQNKSVTTYGIKGDGEISEARANLLAEKLCQAMAGWGTDEDAIALVYDELCAHEKAILQVHEAFGLVPYAIVGYDWLGVKCNLRQWLKKELSAKEYAKWDLLYTSATDV